MAKNYDDLRAEREFKRNPPKNAPDEGWESADDGFSEVDWDSLDEGSSAMEMSDYSEYMGSASQGQSWNGQNGLLGSQGGTGMQGGGLFGGQDPNSPYGNQQIDWLDKTLIIAGKILTAIFSFLKNFVKAVANNKAEDWRRFGILCFKGSLWVFGMSLLFALIPGLFITGLSNRFLAISASCVAPFIIGCILIFSIKSYRVSEPEEDFNMGSEEEEEGSGEDEDYNWGQEEEWVPPEEDEEDDVWSSLTNGSMGDESDELDIGNTTDPDSILEKLDKIPEGMFTRQYLYDIFMTQLPKMCPSFKDMVEVSEDSDEFMFFYEAVVEAAKQSGVKDESKIPDVTSVYKNIYVIQITCTRPSGIKEEEIGDLVADTYKRDEYGRIDPSKESSYATVETRVGFFMINLFLSSNTMVSLGDVYCQEEVKNFVLDTKIRMPIVWGINESGRVFYYDGQKSGNGDMIISGEKRSGKSWKGQSVIAQIAMFHSPKEVEFYFFDSKGLTSDYLYLSGVLPHVKGFCSDPLQYNARINNILDIEIKRREKKLGGQYTNVIDYNKDHPLEKISTLYIVIDEVASARDIMRLKDKDLDKEFVATLKILATKCPNLEIKLMVFPHRIVDDMIPKSVSAMISTRMQMGNLGFEELRGTMDIKNRAEFPYSLVKEGDMAFKTKDINKGRVIYCHAEVLTGSENDNRRLFDFISAVWGKLEPGIRNEVNIQGMVGGGTGPGGAGGSGGRSGYMSGSRAANQNARPVDTSFKKPYVPQRAEEEIYEKRYEVANVDESYWDKVLDSDDEEEQSGDSVELDEEDYTDSQSGSEDADFWKNFG